MANEKRLIDLDVCLHDMCGRCNIENEGCPCEPPDCFIYNVLINAPTVDAVSVEDLERILSTTPGLELWDYQKRGIMSAVYRLCGKEKNDE